MRIEIVSVTGRDTKPTTSEVEESLKEVLGQNQLCSMATVASNGEPHINTCFFASDGANQLFILTPPSSRHAQNLRHDPRISVAVFDSNQGFESAKFGVQLAGRAKELDRSEAGDALRHYSDRFNAMRKAAPDIDALFSGFESRLFGIQVEVGKVFDEPKFGSEVWVTFALHAA